MDSFNPGAVITPLGAGIGFSRVVGWVWVGSLDPPPPAGGRQGSVRSQLFFSRVFLASLRVGFGWVGLPSALCVNGVCDKKNGRVKLGRLKSVPLGITN